MRPFIARSHQTRLTNRLMLALRRDHLQRTLEAFGTALDTYIVLDGLGKGAKAGPELRRLTCLQNWMIPKHVHIYKGARQARKITITLQPPATWQPSYLLCKGGANKHCSKRREIVSKGCLFFYTSYISLIILKS